MVRLVVRSIALLACCGSVAWLALHSHAAGKLLAHTGEVISSTQRRLLGSDTVAVQDVDGSREVREVSTQEVSTKDTAATSSKATTAVASWTASLRGTAQKLYDGYNDDHDFDFNNGNPDWSDPQRIQYQKFKDSQAQSQRSQSNGIIAQLLYGVVFYFLVVSKYPMFSSANNSSTRVMNESAVFRINVGAVCLQTFCCPSAILAHVMQATGVLNYWVALILGSLCPCCTLLGATHFLETGQKLGGQPKGFFPNCLEAVFCSCCVIAQSQDALDAATGVELGYCSVKSNGSAPQAIAQGYVVMPSAPQALQAQPVTNQA